MQRNKLPMLDGLRGIAVLMVLAHHVGYAVYQHGQYYPRILLLLVSSLFSGLDLFFVLSGFLLFLPYARAILEGQPLPSARQFFGRRARRILPAYVLVAGILLLVVLGAQGLGSATSSPVLKDIPWLVVPLYDLNGDAVRLILQLDGPLWSLSVECLFYLLLPGLAICLAHVAGRGSSRRHRFALLLAGLLGMMVVGLVIRAVVTFLYFAQPPADPTLTPPLIPEICYRVFYGIKGRYWEVFALGMATATIYVGLDMHLWSSAPEARRFVHVRLGTGLLAASLVGFVLCIGWGVHAYRFPFAWLFPLYAAGWSWSVFGEFAISICLCLALLASLIAPSFGRALSTAPLRGAGIISYSLYVWHQPILSLILPNLPGGLWGSSSNAVMLGQIFVSCSLCLLAGAVAYFAVERPFLRRPRAATPFPKTAAARSSVF